VKRETNQVSGLAICQVGRTWMKRLQRTGVLLQKKKTELRGGKRALRESNHCQSTIKNRGGPGANLILDMRSRLPTKKRAFRRRPKGDSLRQRHRIVGFHSVVYQPRDRGKVGKGVERGGRPYGQSKESRNRSRGEALSSSYNDLNKRTEDVGLLFSW